MRSLQKGKAIPDAQWPCLTTEYGVALTSSWVSFPSSQQATGLRGCTFAGRRKSNQEGPLPTGPLPQHTVEEPLSRVLQTLYQDARGTWIWDG